MLHSPFRRTQVRRVLGGMLAGTLAAATASLVTLASPAQAAISTPAADAVIRDAGPITIKEDRGGQYANIQAATTSDNFLARGCNGGNANRQKANGRITVTRVSDGAEIVNVFHQTSNNLLNLSAANATGPFEAVWDTTGAQPGLYRIKSVVNDRAKVGSASSQTCTADTNTVLSDFTVEYRPWQHQNFNDFLGHGKVRMNTNPREFQFTVDGATSPVLTATAQEMSFFSGTLPSLPADPSVCATDPSACVPANATACEPSAGCTPRLVSINRKGTDSLSGIFDLETGAFAASATTGGKSRVLASAGGELDATLSDLLAESAANLESFSGLDLLALLSSTIEIRSLNGDQLSTFEVGALRGLQVSQRLASGTDVPGVSIDAPYVVNGGFIFFQRKAALYPAGTTVTPLTVKKSPAVPNLPTLFSVPLGGTGSLDIVAPVPVPAPVSDYTGSLLLVGGGPLVNISGSYPAGAGSYTAGKSMNGPNVDTSKNAPSGLPAWIPGIDQGTMVNDGPIDFVGHAALFLELAPLDLGALGVFDLGAYLIGQGLTVFGDSPLPALGSLPLLWDTENPAAAALNEYTSSLALNLLTNPAVGSVLTATLSLLGGGTPDLESVTATLGDTGTFTGLIDAVAGAAGLDAVPGLEDAVNDAGVVTSLPAPPAPSGGWDLGPILGPLLNF